MVPSHTEQLGPLEMRFCSSPKCQNILLGTKGTEMTWTPENREGRKAVGRQSARTLIHLYILKNF